MSGWNQAPLPRDQILLFRETIGDRIPTNHSVRLLAEILDALDWSLWERHYVLVSGQPPIHPKIMAGAVIYGLTHGIRSSRRLEWACGHAIDFMWLVEGRTIDHSTLCDFRTRFAKELRDLFLQIARVAMHMGLVRLNQVAFDGTRVKACSSRYATASAKTLEERLEVLKERIDKIFSEAAAADEQDQDLFGNSVSTSALPRELGDLSRRQERLGQALKAAQAADTKCDRTSKRAAKVPVADPESSVLPNKEGGYAPNYNPTVAVDGASGMIVDADVLNHNGEAETVLPTVARIKSGLGRNPSQFLADSAFATGGNLSGLASAEVEALMPVDQVQLTEGNPADRFDPSKPVAEEDWSRLPRRARTKKLDRSAFVYDAGRNCYWCPMGRTLVFEKDRTRRRETCEDSEYEVYKSTSCAGCELSTECLTGNSRRRTVMHDQHEAARQATAARLQTKSGRAAYARRAHLAETPIAVIKQVLGLRQFLLRGLCKVRTEWLWACTAFNIKKLISAMAKLRSEALPQPV